MYATMIVVIFATMKQEKMEKKPIVMVQTKKKSAKELQALREL